MPRCDDPTDLFLAFLAAYPQRDEPYDLEATREAWARALTRASPETIIAAAEAYATAMEGRPRRYVMSARCWLNEGRWREFQRSPTQVAPSIWIAQDSPEWPAWESFYRATKGKTPPLDRRGGWRFQSRFPPSHSVAAE
jgi:hypothetical protein